MSSATRRGGSAASSSCRRRCACAAWGARVSGFSGGVERGSVQRFRAVGLWHGLGRAAGRIRPQRRQPDAHGSAARAEQDHPGTEGDRQQHRDSDRHQRPRYDGERLVEPVYRRRAHRRIQSRISRGPTGRRSAIRMAAWPACRLSFRTRSTSGTTCRASRCSARACRSRGSTRAVRRWARSSRNNPAWCLLDVLRRSGWRVNEIDLPSFADRGGVLRRDDRRHGQPGEPGFGQAIPVQYAGARSAYGGGRHPRHPQHGAAAVDLSQQTASSRSTSRTRWRCSSRTKPEGSNAPEMVNGGWPAYVYADGSAPGVGSGILRRPDGAPAFRMWSRPIADTPNRFSVEFADAFNEYQQDSLALVDSEDIQRAGQEISGNLVATGLPTFDQAARILKFFLDRSLRGNRYIEFETSVKGFGQQVGDHRSRSPTTRKGFSISRSGFCKIEPAENYRSVKITAQIHDDAWYNDTNGQLSLIPPTRREPEPVPTVPDSLFGHEYDEFGIRAVQRNRVCGCRDGRYDSGRGGSAVSSAPNGPVAGVVGAASSVCSRRFETTGGTLEGDQTLYYAVTANDGNGDESNRRLWFARRFRPARRLTSCKLAG